MVWEIGRHLTTWQLGGYADSLAPPALLSQNLHFTRLTLLQLLVDLPRGCDAAEPEAQSHHLTLVVEHLVTYVASWLGSFTCMSPFSPETCPPGQAFLEAQRSCHWFCKSDTERWFLEFVFPKPETGKLRHRLWWPDQGWNIPSAPAPGVGKPCAARCPVEDSRATFRPQKLSPQLLLIHGPAVAGCAGFGRKSSLTEVRKSRSGSHVSPAGWLPGVSVIQEIQGSR